jgi:hypothetical protein
MKELLLLRQERLLAPAETCQECGHPKRGGYCYYCGSGKRRERSEAERVEAEQRALKIWDEAVPIRGTAAETYLRRRGIEVELPDPDGVVRWHPRCPFGPGTRVGAMVALLRDVRHDHHPCGVHRTAVDLGGRKLGPAKALGTYYRTAIKLWGEPTGGRLTIGEGIETVMSAVQLRPAFAPAWAVGTAANVGMFPFVDGIKELHILADNDPKENGRVGQEKAKQCSGRYSAWGVKAEVHTPLRHKDFNDILQELRRERDR